LELTIVTSFEVQIENEGSITVPAKAILNFMQYNQDGEVLLETSEGTQLKLHSKHAKATISGEAASGFPTIAGIQRESSLTLAIPPLLKGLSLVTFACAKTTSRPVISGVFTRLERNSLVLVGTDSYRLSEFKMDTAAAEGEVSCIIPARFLEELKGVIALERGRAETTEEKGKEQSKDGEKATKGKTGLETVDVFLSSQQIEVHVGPTRLISRLIDGKFPDYAQVLPKEKTSTVSVSAKELLSAVKRMHYFAKELNNNITFSFTKDGIHLTTKQTQIGRDESTIGAELTGKETKIAISSTYLIDFLSRIDGGSLGIELSDKMHPAVFRVPEADRYLHLIMPLRMSEE
jgi:DNA polymerase-3 subunit beta